MFVAIQNPMKTLRIFKDLFVCFPYLFFHFSLGDHFIVVAGSSNIFHWGVILVDFEKVF